MTKQRNTSSTASTDAAEIQRKRAAHIQRARRQEALQLQDLEEEARAAVATRLRVNDLAVDGVYISEMSPEEKRDLELTGIAIIWG